MLGRGEITAAQRSYLATFDNYFRDQENEKKRELMGNACDLVLFEAGVDAPDWRERRLRASPGR